MLNDEPGARSYPGCSKWTIALINKKGIEKSPFLVDARCTIAISGLPRARLLHGQKAHEPSPAGV
jgi:hypothetical protein